MNSRSRTIMLVGAFIALIVLGNSLFTVNQMEQALILQFGEPVRVIREPGLQAKVPFVQNVEKFDSRILELNSAPRELIASDQKRVIVDSFAKYRITDPLKFYQSVRNRSGLDARLDKVLDSRLRKVLGSVPLSTLLTDKRSEVMRNILETVRKESKDFGIEIVDVRIMRADLPKENSQAIFRRMQTEREREAKEFRAQGAEEAQRITAKAEKDRAVLLAEANSKAQMIKGAGDAEATKVFADAFNADPEFFAFYRTMQAYRESFGKDDTTMVLSPDNEFLKYMR